MSETQRKSKLNLGQVGVLLLSVYVPFLAITIHEQSNSNWSSRLLFHYKAQHQPHDMHVLDDDYRLAAITFFLIWGCAILLYACAILLRKSDVTNRILGAVAGFAAVGGFPLACLSAGGGHLPFLYIELALALACVTVLITKRRLLPNSYLLVLLITHYGLWSWLGGGRQLVGGWNLLWPGWYWHARFAWTNAWLLYPVVGLILSIVWKTGTSETQSQHNLQE